MQNSSYRRHMPTHVVFVAAKEKVSRGKLQGVPDSLKEALLRAHPHIYVDHKALLCLIVMSWIVRAATTTGTAIGCDLVKDYTVTITNMCIARMAGVSAEQLKNTTKAFIDLADKGEQMACKVTALFGDNLPPELPLPRAGEISPWLSPAMWQAVE